MLKLFYLVLEVNKIIIIITLENIKSIDVTGNGKYLLATCESYLMVIPTACKDNNNGFNISMGAEKPKPKVLMIDIGDFALKFTVLFWVAGYSDRYDDTKALVVEEIYNSLRKAGIGIPFPTRTVYMKKK